MTSKSNYSLTSFLGASVLTLLCISCIMFTILGGVSLRYKIERENWLFTKCTVLSIGEKQVQKCFDNGCSDYYRVKWQVEYYNQIAKTLVIGEIESEDQDYDVMESKQLTYRVNSTNPCFFDKKDFDLRWTMPYNNWKTIGITALVFVSLSVVGFITILFIVYQSKTQITEPIKTQMLETKAIHEAGPSILV